eukprot:TRINITY_DN3992_c0_g2_i1.p1 TRINITY_DN3992_c0_g2~~TRINITY_DN3992_c0_g2_i1.p1  ORF type:complete len:604 (+),score=182.03 TRINITY_DN3992_c0_g2_i1:510-2321(+)
MPTATGTVTRTASATATLSSERTVTRTLPTSTATATATVSLPTATQTATRTATLTATVTMPTQTGSGTATVSRTSTASGTRTATRTATATATATLPSASASLSVTLPTATFTSVKSVTESLSLSLPTKSPSMTATATVPSSSATRTATQSLPTAGTTGTATPTLPSASQTHTLTLTRPVTSSPTAGPSASPSTPPTIAPTTSSIKVIVADHQARVTCSLSVAEFSSRRNAFLTLLLAHITRLVRRLFITSICPGQTPIVVSEANGCQLFQGRSMTSLEAAERVFTALQSGSTAAFGIEYVTEPPSAADSTAVRDGIVEWAGTPDGQTFGITSVQVIGATSSSTPAPTTVAGGGGSSGSDDTVIIVILVVACVALAAVSVGFGYMLYRSWRRQQREREGSDHSSRAAPSPREPFHDAAVHSPAAHRLVASSPSQSPPAAAGPMVADAEEGMMEATELAEMSGSGAVAALVGEFPKGTRVLAQYLDGMWHTAHVAEYSPETGTYGVNWADGTRSDQIPTAQLRKSHNFAPGDSVEALEGDGYYRAVIVREEPLGTFQVKWQDGTLSKDLPECGLRRPTDGQGEQRQAAEAAAAGGDMEEHDQEWS